MHFVWANIVVPEFFGTYQEISWYMSFFSPQYARLRFARAKTGRRACKRRREREKRDEKRAREREAATGV